MRKPGTITYERIERISPSQFGSMKNCSYKSILAKALSKEPQLPISPNAYFGTVLHNVLERITKDVITDETVFNSVFTEEIEAMEDKLKRDGYDFFVPLQKTVQDFGIRKILLKKHIQSEVDRKKSPSDCKPQSELWISTKDNLVGGYVDLLLESNSYAELVDFKTGAITRDMLDDSGEIFAEIKPEYSEQLKLYAYAYYETKGRYPDKLTLVDLAKQRFDVSFTPKECKDLYEKAKTLLNEVNQSIETGKFNAVVSEENCKYCLYRPSCQYYKSYLEDDLPFCDLYGTLEDAVKHQNGNTSLYVKNNSGSYIATGIVSISYDEVQKCKGRKIGVYNLKKESKENVYSSRKTTIIYAQ